MATSMEDFEIDIKVIDRIIKKSLPKGIEMSDELMKAMSKSAAIYMLCMGSAAQFAHNNNHINAQMIIQTIVNMGFKHFRRPLNKFLKDYHKNQSLSLQTSPIETNVVQKPKPKRNRKRNNKKVKRMETIESIDENESKTFVTQNECKTEIEVKIEKNN